MQKIRFTQKAKQSMSLRYYSNRAFISEMRVLIEEKNEILKSKLAGLTALKNPSRQLT